MVAMVLVAKVLVVAHEFKILVLIVAILVADVSQVLVDDKDLLGDEPAVDVH